MKIDLITLFPEMFKGPFDESIIRRAQDKSLVEINIHNLRKWTTDKRGTVDDRPYGGGVGMVILLEPIVKAIEELKSENEKLKTKTILLSAKGKLWKQYQAQETSKLEHLILICGHYEGVDERITNFIDDEISIGDYVLTGGEIPAMVLVDSVVRLIPGVLEKSEATEFESFSLLHNGQTVVEYPQYTHPEEFRGLKVPEILRSGNHAEIEKWRKEQALEITKKNRPDLLKC
jgi:tRNA (guanine37-N1)-methyltransferase